MREIYFIIFWTIYSLCYSQQWQWTNLVSNPEKYDTLIFSNKTLKKGNFFYSINNGIIKKDLLSNQIWSIYSNATLKQIKSNWSQIYLTWSFCRFINNWS